MRVDEGARRLRPVLVSRRDGGCSWRRVRVPEARRVLARRNHDECNHAVPIPDRLVEGAAGAGAAQVHRYTTRARTLWVAESILDLDGQVARDDSSREGLGRLRWQCAVRYDPGRGKDSTAREKAQEKQQTRPDR